MKKYILYGLAVAVILTALLLVVSKSNKSKIDEVPEVQNLSVIAQERDESSIDAHATGYEQAVGQQKNNYYIKEVFIDDVKMQHDDYRPFFKGKTIVDSIQWDDNDEVNRRISVYESDSLYIYMSSLDTTHLYSNYIEILSPQHEVKVRDMVFRVGMSVNTIDSIFLILK